MAEWPGLGGANSKAVKIPIGVDKAGGTQQVDEWLAFVNQRAKIQVRLDDKAAKAEVRSLVDELKGAGQEASKGSSGFGDLLGFEKVMHSLRALHALGGVVFRDLSGDAKTFASDIADSATEGLRLGNAFGGPVGAVIGGVFGSLIGYLTASTKATQELNDALAKTTEALESSISKAREFGDAIDVQSTIAYLLDLKDAINAAGDGTVQQLAAMATASDGTNEALSGIETQYQTLIKNIDEATEATDGSKKSFAELQERADDARTKLANIATTVNDDRIEFERLRDVLKSTNWLDVSSLLSQLDDVKTAYTTLKTDSKEATEAVKDAKTATAEEQAAQDKIDNEKKAKKAKAKAEAKQADEDAKKARQEETADWFRHKELVDAVEQDERDQAAATAAYKKKLNQELYDDWIKKRNEITTGDDIARADRLEAEKYAADVAKRTSDEQLADFQSNVAAFSAVLQPFASVTSAVFGKITQNIEQGKKAWQGFGEAFRGGVSEALKALGKQWGAQALGETAAGLASLALGPIGGVSASAHFAAAAGYAAAAIAAGVGGALIGRKSDTQGSVVPSSPGSSAGGGSSGGFSGGPGASAGTQSSNPQAALVVNVYGVPFGTLSERELAAIGGRVNAAQQSFMNSGAYTQH